MIGWCEVFFINCKLGGICFFFLLEESEYDIFICGYVFNFILVVLGMVVVVERKGEKDCYVVVVIGDGFMSGGFVFEGLNNVLLIVNNLLIIFNDNDMVIDCSVGGMK